MAREEYEPLLATYAAMVEARASFTKAYEAALAEGTLAEKTTQSARAELVGPAEAVALLQAADGLDLAEPLVCAEVSLAAGDGWSCAVVPASGEKCPRCWNWRTLGVGGLCARCEAAVAALGGRAV